MRQIAETEDAEFVAESVEMVKLFMTIVKKAKTSDAVVMYSLCAIMLALHRETYGMAPAAVEKLCDLICLTIKSMACNAENDG